MSRVITRNDHDAFCTTEGWQPVRNARGKAVGHHKTYELVLPDGQILRTRISRPVNRDVYGRSMAQHILRDQLRVTAEEFWTCVDDGIRPDRGVPQAPEESLPLDVVHLLINRVGLTEPEVARMTREQAIDALNDYWSRQQ